MGRCNICNHVSQEISKELSVCLQCIRKKPEDALSIAMNAHIRSRLAFGLPERSPHNPDGILCKICANECRIPEGGRGFCGLRGNTKGVLNGVTSEHGKLSWYYDPLPTNCVGDWVCPGGTGVGYPEFAYRAGPEFGYKNLAVFFQACSFNCLFCQNWHFRKDTLNPQTISVNALVSHINKEISCICYFGGDPTPQLPFSLKASRLALEKNKGRILRICWETNGSMNQGLLREMSEIALISGGCIKFDLKAWDENLHITLTGVSNKRTIENFSIVAEIMKKRSVPPLLIANTLLVPGYIDEHEIRNIAHFIGAINPDIPYSLLAFYPHFYMSDLPLTSRSLAEKCRKAALDEGLKNVRIGNVHLLC